ncbi:zinc ribbon domain-containing protein [Candidatus Blastococcus massiliensis]|uniref:zinc ribbon domain-containing protein n=1 Tax=Candidatus Blastococcus massiliensis TaxID=1470358 RepID=UPI0004AC582D|nr:zinc ribbon domain-containing protein [Candidatus Blastococcus massiliensis]
MTGRFCGSCGAAVGPDAAFCASCGTPVAAAPQAAPPQAPPYGQPPVHGQPQAPYGQPPQAALYGQAPYGALPNGAPWGAPPTPGTGGNVAASGRSALDALLTGDWGGAARAAGFAVLAMLGLGLVGMLLLGSGDLGAREILVLTAGAVCAAVGGDIYVTTSGEDFFGGGDFMSSSSSFGVLPLTLTLVGLGLMAWLFTRSLRGRVLTTRDVVLQGARTALVFTACFLVLSLLTRYRTDGSDELLGLSGQLGVSVWSSLMGAFLFAVATLGVVWLFSRVTSPTLPARLAAVREQVVAPLLGAVAVFAAGILGVLVALIYGLVELDERVSQFGLVVLGGGNGMLASILWSAGVPLDADAGVGGEFGEFSGGVGGGNSIDLFTFTDASGWFWLAPVALLLILLAVATVLTVRQNSVEDARREGFRFAGALAVVALVAALLLRVAGGADGGFSEFGASGNVSATFNPIVAAFALGVWGVLAGLLGPVLATRMSSNLVVGIRNRFGAAAPRPVAPAPGQVGQQWQQPTLQQPTLEQPAVQQPGVQQQPYGQPQAYQEQPQQAQPAPYPQQQPLPPVPPPTQ